MDLVEIPPHSVLHRHWHPGEEFHYYLEGEVEIRFFDGGPSIIGKPGKVGHVTFKRRHQAIASEQSAKVLVFRVHTKGEPWRFIEEVQDAAADQEHRDPTVESASDNSIRGYAKAEFGTTQEGLEPGQRAHTHGLTTLWSLFSASKEQKA